LWWEIEEVVERKSWSEVGKDWGSRLNSWGKGRIRQASFEARREEKEMGRIFVPGGLSIEVLYSE
jgi:hypothetical protein